MLSFIALSMLMSTSVVTAQDVHTQVVAQEVRAEKAVAEAKAEKVAEAKAVAKKKAAAEARAKVVASRNAARKALVKKEAAEKKAAKSSDSSNVVGGGTTCSASFYHEPQMTATGEQFDPSAMTAASKTLPLNSWIRVTNPKSGASVNVRINDRGPYVGDRCLDLSQAAFDAIGNTDSGVMTVTYQRLGR